jgi:type VI secretion system protein ImpM
VSGSTVTDRADYFGKLPQLGDFVSGSLPRAFVEPWDTFLRELLASTRETLGADWLDAYLNGPIWRFALGAGLAGPISVVGTLMPSVDRSGRYFPLTIASLTRNAQQPAGDDDWFGKAETLSLEALEDGFDPKTLAARVEGLGVPACGPDVAAGSEGFWWTLGARALAPLGLRGQSLPRGTASTALLDGNWERWGWDVEPIPFDPPLKQAAASFQ